MLNTQEVFGVSVPFKVEALPDIGHPAVPTVDPHYAFDPRIIKALLAGFMLNKRIMLHGLHGTGKSTHIEQAAARLRYPCLRLNLDGHISRSDLVGRDTLEAVEGVQRIIFKEAALPYALRTGLALILDEYDAAPADTAFVLQRLLEQDGALVLPEENRIIHPHPNFRLFATANTAGAGDASGLYHGTSPVNAAQLDRWHMAVRTDYQSEAIEVRILVAKTSIDQETAIAMVRLAALTRTAFAAGDISLMLSPRTVLSWAQNTVLFAYDVRFAFGLSFADRMPEEELPQVEEWFQRCFGNAQI